MPQHNQYEQQFLDALRALFIGAKVEGESGYINLMKIQAAYFEGAVLKRLLSDVALECKPFESSFREELFDKLYDFFRRYFSECYGPRYLVAIRPNKVELCGDASLFLSWPLTVSYT